MSNTPNTVKSAVRERMAETGEKYTTALAEVQKQSDPLSRVRAAWKVLDEGWNDNPCWDENTYRISRLAASHILMNDDKDRRHIIQICGKYGTGVAELGNLLSLAVCDPDWSAAFWMWESSEAANWFTRQGKVVIVPDALHHCTVDSLLEYIIPRGNGKFLIQVRDPADPDLASHYIARIPTVIPSKETLFGELERISTHKGFAISSSAAERVLSSCEVYRLSARSRMGSWTEWAEAFVSRAVARYAVRVLSDDGVDDHVIAIEDIPRL